MLSEVIQSRHSYWAVQLALEPIHQRSVHPGPLVLGASPLNNRTPAEDRKPTCLTHVVGYVLNDNLGSNNYQPLLPEESDYSIFSYENADV